MFELRPYQEEAVTAIRFSHQEHDSTLIELPTGTGKTLCFARYAAGWEHGRTLIIAPFLTLISQAAQKIMRETGISPAIEQASLFSDESEYGRNPYIVASKQTLTGPSKRYRRLKDIGLVIVDEAHYACTEIYAEMLNYYMEKGAKVLGVTATPKRHDKRAMGQIFSECCYQYGILDAVEEGYLVPLRVSVMTLERMNLSKVNTRKGFNGEKDFVQRELNEAVETEEVVYEIAAAVAKSTRDLKTAIYCASVDQACAVSGVLCDQFHIKADWICADKRRCSDKRLNEVMDSFTAEGGITHICNVGMLTVGWDYPNLMCVVNAAPTLSKALFTQRVGRVTRPGEVDDMPVVQGHNTDESRRSAIAGSHKTHGLVIDLVASSHMHKLRTAVDVLGGEWTLEEQKNVLEQSVDKGEVDLAEVVVDVREEDKRLQEEMKRQRVTSSSYREQEVNPYGGKTGKGKNGTKVFIPATKPQMGFLRHKLGWGVNNCRISKAAAGRIIGQLKTGAHIDHVKRTNRCLSDMSGKNPNGMSDKVNQMFSEATGRG